MKINVRAAFEAKNPGLARWLPSAFFGFLERLVHQDEINRFLERSGHLKDLDFALEVLRYFGVSVQAKGTEHLPKEGSFVLVANHPLGGLDGLAIYDILGQHRQKFASLSNDIMMQVQPLNGLFIPVNKHGSQSRDNLRILKERIQEGYGIIVFPSGLVSRRQKGHIRDLEWKKSAVTLARKFHLKVIPVFIEGQLSERFYRTHTWRKRLGISLNLEMLLLPDEMFRLRGHQVTLHIGPPIDSHELHNGDDDVIWTQRLRDAVYRLEPQHPTHERNVTPR
jgi:putative hemolysin